MILVTGGTGLIGRDVLRLLSKAGVSARALARNPQKGEKLPGITWVAGDLARPETLPAAFQGTKTLFLNSAISEDLVALQNNGDIMRIYTYAMAEQFAKDLRQLKAEYGL